VKILDRYILKKYFVTFFFTLMILIPIAIAIDVSEKVAKFLKFPDLTTKEIIRDYYFNFIINYGNTFMPLALFIAVILFTSKLSGNTEIIAIHSSGISFKRFLRPYLIGASIIALVSLYSNHFVVHKSNKTLEEFSEKYLRSKQKYNKTYVRKVSLQLSENDFVFVGNYNLKSNNGYNFSYEKYDGNKLKYKIIGKSLNWNPADSTYKISSYTKRHINKVEDRIESGTVFDTVFDFTPSDLLYVDYLAKELPSGELAKHIDESEKRGVKNLNNYKVELYKRTSLPVSAFILTIIAVSLSSRKRRGGIGFSLAIGITLMFVYIFFLKVSEVLGSTAEANPLLMISMPNILFGILAIFLFRYANK